MIINYERRLERILSAIGGLSIGFHVVPVIGETSFKLIVDM